MCRLGSWHANVFSLLPSQSSSGFWPYPLSSGFTISALVCLDFAFHLLSSVISLSWPHLYLAFAHVQTNLFSLRNSVIGYMCSSFQMSTFLTWSCLLSTATCAFQLSAISSPPSFTLSFNFVGMFLSNSSFLPLWPGTLYSVVYIFLGSSVGITQWTQLLGRFTVFTSYSQSVGLKSQMPLHLSSCITALG